MREIAEYGSLCLATVNRIKLSRAFNESGVRGTLVFFVAEVKKIVRRISGVHVEYRRGKRTLLLQRCADFRCGIVIPLANPRMLDLAVLTDQQSRRCGC